MRSDSTNINKIELINFFEEDEQSPAKKEVEEVVVKKVEPQENVFLEEKKEMISRIKEINIFEETAKS